MKTLSAICTTSLFLGFLLSSSALAHPAPYSHYHPAPAKKKVVYRTTPAPPASVVIIAEEPVIRPEVVVTSPTVRIKTVAVPAPTATAVVTERVVMPRVHRPWHSFLSLGIRGVGAYADGDSLSDEGIGMGGIGATMRTRLSPHFGLELTVDIMGGKTESFSQTTVPLFASASYHFWPDSAFQPYVVAGLGAEFTNKKFLDGRYAFDKVDAGIQVGAGAEFFLTPTVSLTGDVRAKLMGNVSTQAKIRTDCINTSGTMTGFCDNIHSATPGDDVQVGIQAGVGANIYF